MPVACLLHGPGVPHALSAARPLCTTRRTGSPAVFLWLSTLSMPACNPCGCHCPPSPAMCTVHEPLADSTCRPCTLPTAVATCTHLGLQAAAARALRCARAQCAHPARHCCCQPAACVMLIVCTPMDGSTAKKVLCAMDQAGSSWACPSHGVFSVLALADAAHADDACAWRKSNPRGNDDAPPMARRRMEGVH